MISYLLVLVVSLGGAVYAKEYVFSKVVDPSNLASELSDAGIPNAIVSRSGSTGKVIYADSIVADPAPIVAAHVYVDPRSVNATRRARVKTLAHWLKDGTGLTAAEKDELLIKLTILVLGE